MKAKIRQVHWEKYGQQHDGKRGQTVSLGFNVIITITTVLMLISGQ